MLLVFDSLDLVIMRILRALPFTAAGLRTIPLSRWVGLMCPPGSSSSRRRYATLTDLSNYPKPGELWNGFNLKRAKYVPELQLSALQLQHEKTGAEFVHVARDDKNNVFSIGFKTNPPDTTGVPHILEHTTLCGSEKYSANIFGIRYYVKTNIDTQFVTLSSKCFLDHSPIS